MPETPQTQAVAVANNAVKLVRQALALVEQAKICIAQYQAQSVDATWQGMPTASVSADGTLSPDAQPNNGHPISLTSLDLALSEQQLKALVETVLMGIVATAGTQQLIAAAAPVVTVNPVP